MGPLTPIIGLRLLALAAGLRHNAEIGQPGLCFSAYGHKFGIKHLEAEPRLDLAEELARHAGYFGEVIERLEAVQPLAVGDHPGRLRDRESEVAELLEGGAVEVELIAGRGLSCLLFPFRRLGGRRLLLLELDLLERLGLG